MLYSLFYFFPMKKMNNNNMLLISYIHFNIFILVRPITINYYSSFAVFAHVNKFELKNKMFTYCFRSM